MDAHLLELRRYLLHPGRRDELIELFDREFVETQEAVGMDVIGQFRDREQPDLFVWLRGFPDMVTRHRSLTDFYTGPVWHQHRDAANATMIDSDNVHLLRPVTPADRLPDHEPARRDSGIPGSRVIVILDYHDPGTLLAEAFDTVTRPALEAAGFTSNGLYETEPSPNTFTPLPVRADHVIAWFGTCVADDSPSALADIPRAPATRHREIHHLQPTSRSALIAHRHTGEIPAQ